MADPDTAHVLTQQQVDFFHNEGYLHVQNVLTNDDLQPAIDELTGEVDQRARKLVERGELSRTYEEEGFETRLARISQETDQIAISISNSRSSLPAPRLCRRQGLTPRSARNRIRPIARSCAGCGGGRCSASLPTAAPWNGSWRGSLSPLRSARRSWDC